MKIDTLKQMNTFLASVIMSIEHPSRPLTLPDCGSVMLLLMCLKNDIKHPNFDLH